MENLAGKKWKELKKETQEKLLKSARGWDENGNYPTTTKECIIDLIYPYSITGKVIVTDEETYIEIEENAIIYNSEDGIILEDDIKDLISLTEYAKLHNIDTSSVRRKILRGNLPAKKIGRNWVIDKNQPYIDKRKRGE